MNEHPILFSETMVQAILDGRKTQTRRVVKPQHEEMVATGGALLGWTGDHWHGYISPFGWPGDHLWVRETFTYVADGFAIRPGIAYRADKHVEWLHAPKDGTTVYNADNPECWKWRPSIHMPRWASRITLEIVNVRVERVQEIGEEDAFAEGAQLGRVLGYGRLGMQSHREGFMNLWDEINDKRGFGWLSNPWVWVIKFKKVKAERADAREGEQS